MAPKFGTSGLRGLVTELTPDLVGDYIRAFVAACDTGSAVWVGHDLRDSSPDLAGVVAEALRGQGVDVMMCGAVPTPALALAAMGRGGAVMITGSHIPADRNGLKFYTPAGEISKLHEGAILAARGTPVGVGGGQMHMIDAATPYVARYTSAFAGALAGQKIGVWAQSAVGRDIMATVLRSCGATVSELGRLDRFIPIDTEAVPEDVRAQLVAWSGGLDAIVSADADGDRPLLTDQHGNVIGGDTLGQIAGTALAAEVAVTPVSSNSGAEDVFACVVRTCIGSPHVIAGMAGQDRVVGYEANGGFLLGFDARGPAGPVAQLLTRDGMLPMLLTLAAGKGDLAGRVAAEPARFTAADRVQGVPSETGQALTVDLLRDPGARAGLLAALGLLEDRVDATDGLRMTAVGGRVLHLRPSGNAPEFRVYSEAESPKAAQDLLAAALSVLVQRYDWPA